MTSWSSCSSSIRTPAFCSRSAGPGERFTRRGSTLLTRSSLKPFLRNRSSGFVTGWRARVPTALEQAREGWERLAAGIRRLDAAGVRIGVGTDGGGQTGDQFVGWTMHTEMENMVAAGMTPAQVLVGRDENVRGDSRTRRAGDGGGGQERGLRRARRQSSGRHHQFETNRPGLSAGPAGRSGKAESGLGGELKLHLL